MIILWESQREFHRVCPRLTFVGKIISLVIFLRWFCSSLSSRTYFIKFEKCAFNAPLLTPHRNLSRNGAPVSPQTSNEMHLLTLHKRSQRVPLLILYGPRARTSPIRPWGGLIRGGSHLPGSTYKHNGWQRQVLTCCQGGRMFCQPKSTIRNYHAFAHIAPEGLAMKTRIIFSAGNPNYNHVWSPKLTDLVRRDTKLWAIIVSRREAFFVFLFTSLWMTFDARDRRGKANSFVYSVDNFE